MGRPREFNEAEVVEKAMLLFWKHGWRDTTPKLLLEATGLSRSSLYATFGSKQKLFLSALNLYVEVQRSFLTDLLADGTLREGLERLYELMVDKMGPENPRMTCLVASSLMEIPADDDESIAAVALGSARITEVYADRFQRAIDEGELDGSRTAEALAQFVSTVNNGIQLAARSRAGKEELRSIAQIVLETVC